MLGILAIGHVGDWINTVLVLVDLHLKEAVRSEKFPPGKYFPIGEWLNAVRPTAHLVVSHQRKRNVGRYGVPFQEGRPRFGSPEIGVIVIEGRDVQ